MTNPHAFLPWSVRKTEELPSACSVRDDKDFGDVWEKRGGVMSSWNKW